LQGGTALLADRVRERTSAAHDVTLIPVGVPLLTHCRLNGIEGGLALSAVLATPESVADFARQLPGVAPVPILGRVDVGLVVALAHAGAWDVIIDMPGVPLPDLLTLGREVATVKPVDDVMALLATRLPLDVRPFVRACLEHY
jgi:hypothetical protein